MRKRTMTLEERATTRQQDPIPKRFTTTHTRTSFYFLPSAFCFVPSAFSSQLSIASYITSWICVRVFNWYRRVLSLVGVTRLERKIYNKPVSGSIHAKVPVKPVWPKLLGFAPFAVLLLIPLYLMFGMSNTNVIWLTFSGIFV